jgi:hypothetical protein
VDSAKEYTMTEEVKPEVKVETTPEIKSNLIGVDIDGVQVQVDVETGKKLIEARQKVKKEVKDLQEKVSRVEASAKQEADRARLIEAMKASDIESVKSQVSAEYLDKISKYENKIFKGEVKSLLATSGVLPEALDDACSLALASAKVSLEGDTIKINDKTAKDYLDEFIKTRPHLVAVKQTEKAGVKAGKAPKDSGFSQFSKTLFK